jgi:hypothetical protein
LFIIHRTGLSRGWWTTCSPPRARSTNPRSTWRQPWCRTGLPMSRCPRTRPGRRGELAGVQVGRSRPRCSQRDARHSQHELAPPARNKEPRRGAGLGSIIPAQPGLPTCSRTQRGRTETGSHSANPPTQHRAAELVAQRRARRKSPARAGLSAPDGPPKQRETRPTTTTTTENGCTARGHPPCEAPGREAACWRRRTPCSVPKSAPRRRFCTSGVQCFRIVLHAALIGHHDVELALGPPIFF